MEMQMIDRLAAVGAVVDDHAVAAVEVELFRQIADHEPEMGEQRRVGLGQCRDVDYWTLRNQEHMSWRLRGFVVQGVELVVFINDVGWYLVVDVLVSDG